MNEPTVPLNNDDSHGCALRWTKWIGHLAGQPNLSFLEVGSYEGASARWFLRNVLTHPGSRLLCVDTWAGGEDMKVFEGDDMLVKFLNNIEPWKDKCGCMRGRSQDVLTRLSAEYDFAYIDGSHTAPNVLADSVLVWRLVKVGGYIIWDDYLWEIHANQPLRKPLMAIDAFLACYDGKYEMIEKQWQVCIRKVSS